MSTKIIFELGTLILERVAGGYIIANRHQTSLDQPYKSLIKHLSVIDFRTPSLAINEEVARLDADIISREPEPEHACVNCQILENVHLWCTGHGEYVYACRDCWMHLRAQMRV